MSNDRLAIVQFMHPGKERKPEPRTRYAQWRGHASQQPHTRKFMEHTGQYVTPQFETKVGPVRFWNEWEPPSKVVSRWATGSPEYLHKPFFVDSPDPTAYDTDPCVFGNEFKSAGCLQLTHKGTRESALRRLDVGSMIIFGSRVNTVFALDTILVVRDFVDGKPFDGRSEFGERYDRVTYDRRYADIPELPGSLRIYKGATLFNTVHGMYSFTPCMPAGDNVRFERPNIVLPPYVTQELSQGKKVTTATGDEVVAAWESIVDQVTSRGLSLGTWFEDPIGGPL